MLVYPAAVRAFLFLPCEGKPKENMDRPGGQKREGVRSIISYALV